MSEQRSAMDENKALIHLLFEEGLHQGNLTIIDTIFSPAFVDHSTPQQPTGRTGVREYLAAIRTGFPDIQVSIDDLLADGDKVIARTIWRGTHLGTYESTPPTGQHVVRTLIQIFRILDSQIVEEWNEGGDLLARD